MNEHLNILSCYIEHNELEKVARQITVIKGNADMGRIRTSSTTARRVRIYYKSHCRQRKTFGKKFILVNFRDGPKKFKFYVN